MRPEKAKFAAVWALLAPAGPVSGALETGQRHASRADPVAD